jgi:predicted transcriptional regulator
MKVLLSIKPEFANMIFAGTKKFEFRRAIFRNEEVKTVVVYASAPTKKIIGEFEIEKILNEEIENLWEMTKKFAGIKKEYYLNYFFEKEIGYAIKIKNTKKYKHPLCIKEHFNLAPPQSFLYLKQ